MLQQILDRYPEEQFLAADGFEEALIGVDEGQMRLIYSVEKCMEILCRDMPLEDALEFFDFNIAGAYMGERTPIWCYDSFPPGANPLRAGTDTIGIP